MKIRAAALVLVCIFRLQGAAAAVNGTRAANTSARAKPAAPVSARKSLNDSHPTSAAVRPKETVRKAQATDRVAAHPTSGYKWRCEHSARNHRYRAAHGVVCWDGRIYGVDDGGIPQYMLDYFAQDQRNFQQNDGRTAELEAARPGYLESPSPVRPVAYARATVAPAEAVPTVPVSPEVFASIDVGMARSMVLDKLGKPAGSITIPGDDGFIEIWTYQLTNGSTAKLNMEKGIVSTLAKNGGT